MLILVTLKNTCFKVASASKEGQSVNFLHPLFSSDNSKLFTASHTEVIVAYRLQDVLINVDHCLWGTIH